MARLEDIKIELDEASMKALEQFAANVIALTDAVSRFERALQHRVVCRHCRVLSTIALSPGTDCPASTSGHHWEPYK